MPGIQNIREISRGALFVYEGGDGTLGRKMIGLLEQ